ncbi:MAG: hypothetical protein PUP93_16640 [Rhizonema sp. NSF051]|nr:hypothetical protein [Rhizonema sp. NSF051]
MQNPEQKMSLRCSLSLEQRKTWFFPVADVYYKARTPYSQEVINSAVTLARLSPDAMILEVGCDSGTTV